MARARRTRTESRDRYWGTRSGVTFETIASGTTISYSGVTATVLSGTYINATQLKGTQLVNATGSGYVMPFMTTGLLAKVGSVGITTGVTKVEASYFGLSAVYFCLAALGVTNLTNTSGTSCFIQVTTAKPIPAAGVSRVYFRLRDAGGAAVVKPVSAQYFAVGV